MVELRTSFLWLAVLDSEISFNMLDKLLVVLQKVTYEASWLLSFHQKKVAGCKDQRRTAHPTV